MAIFEFMEHWDGEGTMGFFRCRYNSRALETPSSDTDTRMGREHPRRGSLAYPGMGRRRLRGPRLGKTRKTLSALVETNETTDDGAMNP